MSLSHNKILDNSKSLYILLDGFLLNIYDAIEDLGKDPEVNLEIDEE